MCPGSFNVSLPLQGTILNFQLLQISNLVILTDIIKILYIIIPKVVKYVNNQFILTKSFSFRSQPIYFFQKSFYLDVNKNDNCYFCNRCILFHRRKVKLLCHSITLKEEQQQEYFPVWDLLQVGLECGVEEPVLGYKNIQTVLLVVVDYYPLSFICFAFVLPTQLFDHSQSQV